MGLELVELAFEQQVRWCTGKRSVCCPTMLGHLVDVRVQERFAAGYRDHRRPALFDGGYRLVDRELLAQDLGRVLDFAATMALEVAVEQWFKLDYEGVLVPLGELLRAT